MKTYSVYSITTHDGRAYIGYTSNPHKERWAQHRRRLRLGNHQCSALQAYSGTELTFTLLATFQNKQRALAAEALLMDLIPDTLNSYNPGDKPDLTAMRQLLLESLASVGI